MAAIQSTRLRLFALLLLTFQQTLIVQSYFRNATEAFVEYEQYRKYHNTSCNWQFSQFIYIVCPNNLTILNQEAEDNNLIAISVFSPQVSAADDLIDYTLKSLQNLSFQNEFPFELLLHLLGVRSNFEFNEKFKNTCKLDLQFDNENYYYKFEYHDKRPLFSKCYLEMTLKTGNQIRLTENFFARMMNLRSLKVSEIDFDNLSENMLNHMSYLTVLNVTCNGKGNRQRKLRKFERAMFDYTPLLETVVIQSCGIDEFPEDMLFNLYRITSLDISNNNVQTLPYDFFKHQTGLRKLYLNGNKLKVLQSNIFQVLPQLGVLDCSFNLLNDFPSDLSQPHDHLYNLRLESNFLTDDITADLWRNFPMLIQANLKKNKIGSLSLNFLNEATDRATTILEIDLQYNKINRLWTDELSGTNVNNYNGIRLGLSHNPLHCYCDPNEIFGLQKKPQLPAVDVSCRHWGAYMIQIPLNSGFDSQCRGPRNSDKSPFCPKFCLCDSQPGEIYSIYCAYRKFANLQNFNRPLNQTYQRVVMDISEMDLQELPVITDGYAEVTELIARNNSLRQINISNIPPKLTFLDLRGNQLKSLDMDVINLMSSNSMQLRLSDNPWECDCDLWPLLNFMKTKPKAFEDLKHIECDSYLKKIRLMDLNKTDIVCLTAKKSVSKGIIASIVLILIIVILSSLICFYKNAIKRWLCGNKMCRCVATEKELEKDRTYDAFVIFSNEDELFFATELKPQLEEGTMSYNLCTPNRDWNIDGSVEDLIKDSRRTIAVVSKNFLKSNYCLSEFHIAHESSLKGKHVPVIVILYEIKSNEIVGVDETLEVYLKTNNYLELNDTMFWKKLQNAMPHTSQYKIKQSTINASEMDEV